MSAAPLARSSFSSPLIPKRETLFEQVGRSVTDLIRSGEWKPGEMLPTEIEMAARFGVSQGTMRRALKILVDSGVLVRQQGRGTFVAEFSRNETLVFERYIRLEPDRNTPHAVSPTHAELLEFGLVTPPKEVADALERRADAPLVHAVRLLDSTCGPVTYDELWLDPEVFRDLTAENLMRHEEKMLYAFYQRACGVTIVRCDEYAKAVLMPENLCDRLGLKPPFPVLEIRRVARTYEDRPVEYRRQLCITEHYRLKLG